MIHGGKNVVTISMGRSALRTFGGELYNQLDSNKWEHAYAGGKVYIRRSWKNYRPKQYKASAR